MEGHRDDRVDRHTPREIAGELERDESAEVLGQPGLAAVLEPANRSSEGSVMRARRADGQAAVVRDRLALDAAWDAEPAPGLTAARAARHEEDVADRERELHHRGAASDEMSSSPACVPVRAAVPAGSSSTPSVPRGAPTAGTQGRRFSATRRTRIDRSTKRASIANRMKNIVIDPVFVIRRPSPSARPDRGMSPKPRVRKLLATLQRVASTVPRVRFVIVMGPRSVLDRAAGLHRGERGGREDDDEERGENAADGREHDEDRGARRLYLGTLPAVGAHLLGLDAEHLRHRHTELVGLDDRRDEVLKLFHLDAFVDAAEGLLTRLADALLGSGALELLGERTLQLLRHLDDRGVESETGLHRDREQVERVGKLVEDRVGAAAGPAVEIEVRNEEAEDQPSEQTTDRGQRVAGDQVQQGRPRDGGDDSDERLDAEEELDARRLHRRALEPDLERLRRVGRVEARDDRREALDDRLQGSLGDRPLQFELFEGPRTNRDLLESCLHRVELLTDEERREHEEDSERDDAGEDQDLHD